jgi:hypothetical protein
MGISDELLVTLRSELEEMARNAGPSRGLYGAQAGAAVQKTAPHLDVRREYGSLRAFIEAKVPGLAVIGRSGADICYGLREWNLGGTASDPRLSNEDPWRIWTSPDAPRALSIAIATGVVTAVRRGSEGKEGFIIIDPAPADLHRDMARAFLEDLRSSDRIPEVGFQRLDETITTDPRWWLEWRRVATDMGVERDWASHREKALLEAFKDELAEKGMSGAALERAVATIRSQRRPAIPQGLPPSVRAGDPKWDDRKRLVALAQAAVAGLPTAEILALRFPLGIVLEALGGSNRRDRSC